MSTRGLRSSDIFLVTVMTIHMGRVLRVPRNPASPNLPLAEFEVLCSLMKRLTVNRLLEHWGCAAMRKELFAMVQRLFGSRHVR